MDISKALRTLATLHPTAQCNIPEDSNLPVLFRFHHKNGVSSAIVQGKYIHISSPIVPLFKKINERHQVKPVLTQDQHGSSATSMALLNRVGGCFI
jgi:hypothetical protein